MNEHLITNNHGLRLLQQFEGDPRLVARECEGGRWELGWGCTFHTDNRPVEPGETCTRDYADALFRHALETFERTVRRHVTVELNENQFSALVALVYNIGEENFATGPRGPCTVLRETNVSRFDDAAAAFGMWVFATKNGYKQALRGLLRRHYAEACLYLGYDWGAATQDEAIALQREKPASIPGVDRVIYKTPWSEVLRVAQAHPLDDELELFDPIVIPPVLREPPSATAPVVAGGGAALPAAQPSAPSPASPVKETSSAASVVPSAAEKQGAGASSSAPSPATSPATKPKTLDHIAKDAGLDRNGIQKAVVAVLVWIGYTMRTVGANGMKIFGLSGSTVSVLADQLNQPFVQILIGTAFFVCICGVLWAMGLIAEKMGLNTKKKIERKEAAA